MELHLAGFLAAANCLEQDEWPRGDIDVDPYITHHMTHDKINTAFDLLKAGESIRSVIHFRSGETMTVNSLPKFCQNKKIIRMDPVNSHAGF